MAEHDALAKRPLSLKEAARYLGCSVSSVQNRIKEGMPHHRVGRLLRFYADEIDAWVREASHGR